MTRTTPGGAVASWSIAAAWRSLLRSHPGFLALVYAAMLTGCDATFTITGNVDRLPADLSLAEINMISGDGQDGLVGSLAPEELVVQITDEHGNALAGAPIEWSFTQGRGVAAEGEPFRALFATTTDAQGRSEAKWELGTTAGVQQAWVRIVTPEDPAGASDGPEGAPDAGKGKKVGFHARARPTAPAELSVTPSSARAAPGDTTRLRAVVVDKFGNDVQDVDVEWRSSNDAVATVDATGLVHAVSDGSAQITAAAAGLEGSAELLVSADDRSGGIADITIAPSELTLYAGDTVTVTATAVDSAGEPVPGVEFEWTSSDPKVASVSPEGLVKANAVGAVLVSATVACGMSACEATTEVQVQQEEGTGVPGTVTDLRVVEANATSVTLAFTQVDDGTGNPAKYAIRHGSPTLSWGPASPTEIAVDGTSVGAVLQYPHNGLEPGTDYQFQLVSYRGDLGSAEFGELSNKASASTEAVEAGDPASLTLSPSSATIRVGRSIELTADVRDADGILVTDATIDWSTSNPGVATVSSEGVVNGTGIGTAVITATAMCGAAACSASSTDNGQVVVQEAPSGAHPNEPAGFTTITDNPFDVEEASGWTCWSCGNLSIRTDPDAPISPNNVAAARFPDGFVGGSGPINMTTPGFEATDFYLHFSFKISENWDGHSSGINKIFFIKDGEGPPVNALLTVRGAGNDRLELMAQIENNGLSTPDGPTVNYQRGGATNGDSNEVSAPAGTEEIVRGRWYEIEMVLHAGTPGGSDGEVHVWLDGTKIIEYTRQRFIPSGKDGRFDRLQWNPTYGGGSIDSVDEEQYQYIDHLYLSRK